MPRNNHQRPCMFAVQKDPNSPCGSKLRPPPYWMKSDKTEGTRAAWLCWKAVKRARKKRGLPASSDWPYVGTDLWSKGKIPVMKKTLAQEYREYVSFELGEGRRRYSTIGLNKAHIIGLRHFTRLAATVLP